MNTHNHFYQQIIALPYHHNFFQHESLKAEEGLDMKTVFGDKKEAVM